MERIPSWCVYNNRQWWQKSKWWTHTGVGIEPWTRRIGDQARNTHAYEYNASNVHIPDAFRILIEQVLVSAVAVLCAKILAVVSWFVLRLALSGWWENLNETPRFWSLVIFQSRSFVVLGDCLNWFEPATFFRSSVIGVKIFEKSRLDRSRIE